MTHIAGLTGREAGGADPDALVMLLAFAISHTVAHHNRIHEFADRIIRIEDAKLVIDPEHTGGLPMAGETINATLRQTNLTDESEQYLLKREELRRAEMELRNQHERVAELRRHLPKGPAVEDYVFEEGPVKLDAGDNPIRTV